MSPSCHQANHRRHRRLDREGDPDRVPQAAAEARRPAVGSRYRPTGRDPRLPHLPAGPDHAGAGRAEGLPASRGPPSRGPAPRGGRRCWPGSASRTTPGWSAATPVADQNVATLRAEVGRNPYDKALSDLIGELSTRGDTFRQRWARHEVRAAPGRRQAPEPPARQQVPRWFWQGRWCRGNRLAGPDQFCHRARLEPLGTSSGVGQAGAVVENRTGGASMWTSPSGVGAS